MCAREAQSLWILLFVFGVPNKFPKPFSHRGRAVATKAMDVLRDRKEKERVRRDSGSLFSLVF